MRYGSLFSGIGGFDLGLDRAGMECAWQVEIDPHCREVLTRHWPDVMRYEDVRTVGTHNLSAVDLICGGFPCQDVSVAGRRAGLAGARSGLWSEFHRILAELTPEWVVIENVPGLLSSNGGWDFATVLHGLVELRYGVCWRILDAQYFGVAQRRRRVFLVGHLGDGRAAEVLFERESLPGNTAESRAPGQDLAYALAAGAGGSKFGSGRDGQDTFIPLSPTLSASGAGFARTGNERTEAEALVVATPITTSPHSDNASEESKLVVEVIDVRNLKSQGKISGTLQSKKSGGYSLNYQNPVAFEWQNGSKSDRTRIVRSGDYAQIRANSIDAHPKPGNLCHPLTESARPPSLTSAFGVRRLTPTECERLQGFPDGFTAGQSDSARYRQLGNAVCVPVVAWIARRIMEATA